MRKITAVELLSHYRLDMFKHIWISEELDALVGGWLEEHKQKRLLGGEGNEEQDFIDIFTFDADTISKATSLASTFAFQTRKAITVTVASGSSKLAHILNILPYLMPCICLEKVLRNTIPDQVRHGFNISGKCKDLAQIFYKEACSEAPTQSAQEELDIFVGKDRNVQEAGIKNLRYLQAVVKETLRMYAPSPILLRAAKDDCTLSNGYHVAAGTSLMLNIWKIQCDERVWSDPNEFQPERFLTSHKDTDVWGLNFEMIPFGSRRRSCPGVSLALQMLNLTMASLLHSFEG
ncbi:cytochrome P450 82C3 [Citrus sinensis]|uniref:Cytochrome P450 82C3 n=1 Tax=Citrus sinensis TaxID=2711 RepID=A0ACB8J283_CITSI|nr:cytochrome P450 82C3 [Citrus sinensis]